MRKEHGSFVFGLVIFLFVSGLPAFSPAAEETNALTQSIRREIEQNSLAEAMSAFNAGEYRRAKIALEVLSETAQNAEISRQAIFGLASIKLILANTLDEYEDAISCWQKWSGQFNLTKGCDDPRLITPFLLRLQSSMRTAEGKRSEAKSRRAAEDVDSKMVLQTKEKKMQRLQAKLEMREREIRRLRQQLESLEEIHRKYQEKKQKATD